MIHNMSRSFYMHPIFDCLLVSFCISHPTFSDNFPRPVIFPVFLSYGSTGGGLNKKDGLTRYGDSHVKDKTS